MTDIYLDFNASTPIDPRVAAVMEPLLTVGFGNPSSMHWAAEAPRHALHRARTQVADLLGAAPDEIVFTSGGSEANNLALVGAWFATRDRGNHVIISAVEHPSVVEPCRFLERLGARVSVLPVDATGLIDPDDLAREIDTDTILVSVMHANNEVGTIEPIATLAQLARSRGVLFHTDAAQSVGKIPTRIDELGVDLLTIAGHKLYAPKGVGALYIRSGVQLEPLIHGAGHEAGRRAGTESALLAAGLGEACALATDLAPMTDVRCLRDEFWDRLRATFGDEVVLNGHPNRRLPNTLNVSFPGRVGADILARLDGVAASTGSACHEGAVNLSPTLRAMGVSDVVGAGAIRFSLGRTTTELDIGLVMERLVSVLSGQ